MELINLLNLLSQGYYECNSKGHLKPDVKNNFCNYCYRHLDYTPLKNEDVPQFERQNRRHIIVQMRRDYNEGLVKDD